MQAALDDLRENVNARRPRSESSSRRHEFEVNGAKA
jgi:hypothetical protein